MNLFHNFTIFNIWHDMKITSVTSKSNTVGVAEVKMLCLDFRWMNCATVFEFFQETLTLKEMKEQQACGQSKFD